MAYVGLRYPVFAPITTEARGKAIVYGTGMVIGRAISANVEFTRNEGGLYADDILAESDNSITGGTIEIGLDDALEDVQAAIFGVQKSGETGQEVYTETDAAAPYGGFGYIRVRRHKGVTSYIAYWIHKTQFAPSSESAQTKGETIEWQTPTASGNIMGVYIDASGVAKFRDHKVCATEEAAVTWLNGLAKIASGAGA